MEKVNALYNLFEDDTLVDQDVDGAEGEQISTLLGEPVTSEPTLERVETISVIHQQYNIQQNIQQTINPAFPYPEHFQRMEKFEKIKISLLAVILGVAVSLLITAFFMYQKLKDIERVLQNAEIYSEEIYKSTDELRFILNFKESLGISYNAQPLIQNAYAQAQNLYTEGDFSITAKIIDPDTQREHPVEFNIEKETDTRYVITSENAASALEPGNYQLRLDLKKGMAKETKTQDFSWGVLVINTNKPEYHPGETANIAMAVLDEKGNMVCDANVELKITDPNSVTTTLSTEDSSIKVNDGCHKKEMILEPDFEAQFQVGVVGSYVLELTAVTTNGSYTIYDSFKAKSYIPFEIERLTATRIYPPEIYPVTIKVTAHEDYQGKVSETVPWEFKISDGNGYTPSYDIENELQKLNWQVDWKAGQTYTLSYKYKAVNRSPDFYVLGPLTIGENVEGRVWQIAADAASAGAWWDNNYKYRQKITLTAGSAAVPTDYSIKLGVNHANLVTNGKSLSNGDDIRIAYWNGSSWTELDRALGESFSWNSAGTQVWFRTQSAISASGSDDNYYLYYGYSSASSPPENKSNVYLFWDDYNRANTSDITAEAAYTKTNGGTWSIESNTLKNVGAAGDPNKLLIASLGSSVGDVEMMIKIDVTTWLGTNDLGRMGLSSHMTAAGAGYAGLFHNDQSSLDLLNDLLSWGTLGSFSWSTSTWYYMKYQVYNPSARTGRISTWLISGTDPGTWTVDGNFGGGAARTSGYVGVAGSRRADVTYFDDLWVRKLVNPEPTNAFSTEEKITLVSGNAYTDDDEVTPLSSFTQVCIAKNTTEGGYCRDTDGSGAFAIPVIDVTVSDQLTVFLDHASTHGNVVTKAGTNDISGVKLYQNHVVLRSDTGSFLAIVDMDAYDNDQNSTDMLFDAEDASPDTLTWESGAELYVQNGYTFQPGGNVNGHDIEIDGVWTASSGETIDIDGSFKLDTGGTFNPSTSTLTFDATSGTENLITDGTGDLYNLVVDDGGGGSLVVAVEDPLTVENDITITNGTLDVVSGEDNQINVGGDWTNNDIFLERAGTVVFDGASDATLDSGCADEDTCTNENFYNLTIDKSADAQVTLSNTHLRVTNLLNIVEGWLIQGSFNVRAEGSTAVDIDDFGRWSNTSTGDLTLGGNFINDGSITLYGNGATCGEADSITIASTNTTPRSWSGAGGFRISDVSVSYQTGSAVIYAASSTNSGNNGSNWKFVDCNEILFNSLDLDGIDVD